MPFLVVEVPVRAETVMRNNVPRGAARAAYPGLIISAEEANGLATTESDQYQCVSSIELDGKSLPVIICGQIATQRYLTGKANN